MNNGEFLVFFGHHKCASTYINQIISYLCALLGMRVKIEYFSKSLPMNYHLIEPHKTQVKETIASIQRDAYDFLCHGNADRDLLDVLGNRAYRGFHVIRDPRDVVVSGYFSHKFSHPVRRDFNPWLLEHRESLCKVAEEEGLILEIEFCKTYFERMQNWDYANSKVYETRFETLTVEPEKEFGKILDFLGITIPNYDLFRCSSLIMNKIQQKIYGIPMKKRYDCPQYFFRRIIRKNAFEIYTNGRKKGEQDLKSHFRNGLSGDWKNYFTPKIKNIFKQYYGQLLVDLKYERDLDW